MAFFFIEMRVDGTELIRANMPSGDYWCSLNVEDIDKIYTDHFTLLRK